MKRSLSENLKRSLHTETGEDVSVSEIINNVEEQGFGLLLMVLALPSALPIPAAGYSTPFGIIFLLLGSQMVLGRHRPWLPQRAMKTSFSESFAEKTIGRAANLIARIECLVRPRLEWINSPFGMRLMGFVVIVMAALMALPIPLTNTAPAFVIFLIGIGLSEKDGLFSFGACALGLVAIALYAFVIYILATKGIDGVEALKDLIKEFFGLQNDLPA